MDGLDFRVATSVPQVDLGRADVACFAGFVAARHDAASNERLLQQLGIIDWWLAYGWLSPGTGRRAEQLLQLLDVPVPIETWDAFDTLFAWDRRPLVSGRVADTMLGAAVRRFFLQGGRKCYVVRAGNPWPLFERPDAPTLASKLLASVPEPSPVDRASWRGVGHIFGLPEASFLCTPDLPEIFAVRSSRIAPLVEPAPEERFVECGDGVNPSPSESLRAFPAPRCDEHGFRTWAAFVARTGQLLARYRRDVQYVAAVPLPDAADATTAARQGVTPDMQWAEVASIQTAFVQLTYPWLRTPESTRLPGALEAPDAMVTGTLANSALTSGAWRTIAREPIPAIVGLEPVLGRSQLERVLPYHGAIGARRVERTLRQRISVFSPAPVGFQLLSDVTTDDDEAYRPANINRLVAALVRAAQRAGESAVFAINGEALWRRLRSALEGLLLQLWGDGALAGASATEAFDVRCDRSTMTQADLDNGRAIARVQFIAASPIERITVVFAMDEGSQVSVVSAAALDLEAIA